jgi:quercetin dioxygenase-like cupin family protein
MNDFPAFMKHPANRVDAATQYTPGIEGYVFDGVDGSQMAFWTYTTRSVSAEHNHEYKEYILVVQGTYTLRLDGERISLDPGEEYVIPKGVAHSGEAVPGTRIIYAFGGKRAKRVGE